MEYYPDTDLEMPSHQLRDDGFTGGQNLNGAVDAHEQTTNEANDALPLPNEKTNEKVEDNDNNSTWSWDTATTGDDDNDPLQPPSLPVRQLGLSRRAGSSNYVDYDVITVHGVRDDHQTAWTAQDDDSNWIEDTLFQNLSIRQLDYVYDIGNSACIYDPSADGISTEANALLESLAQDRAKLPETEANRPIIWICHDLGGSIVKKALINALHNEPDPELQDGPIHSLQIRTIYRRLTLLTSSIIFLACPHNNESKDELEDQLLALMKLPGPLVTTQLLKKVANLSRQIERINLEFLETNVLDHAVIVKIATDLAEDTVMASQTAQHSTGDNQVGSPTGGAQTAATRCFTGGESSLHHNLGFQYSYNLTGTDHLGLVRGSSALDSDWVSRLSSLFNKKPGFNIEKHHRSFVGLEYQSSFLSLSPPTREYKYEVAVNSLSQPPAMSWIPPAQVHAIPCTLPPVMWWILEQDSVVRQLAREHESRIVHLHAGWSASQAIDVKKVSQRLYTAYDLRNHWQPENGCFYFEFDDHDSRRAGIKDMIVSFMSIFTGRFWTSEDDHYLISSAEYMRRFRSWSLRHLINVFLDVQKASSMNKITIILGGFDNCEEKERSTFTQALLDRCNRSERWFNLVITTRKPDELLCDRLPPANIISLEDCPLSVEDYLAFPGPLVTEDRIKRLLARRPEFAHVGVVLSQIFGKFEAVPILQERVLEWLANYPCDPFTEITDMIRQTACNPHQELLSGIVNQLSTAEQRIMIHLYDWIKYAAEPLTLEMLVESVRHALPREMARLKQISTPEEFSSFLESVMGGIILRDGRDFKFSDAAFYNVSPNTEPDAEWDQVHRSHASMATACLHYLLGTEGQEMLISLSVEKQGIGDLGWSLITLPRNSLVSYALRFWTVHYRAASDYRPADLALELLQNGPKKAAWAEAIYVTSNPFTRMERDYVSSLPYMAMFGLDDLVRGQIENEGGQNSRNRDYWLAIAEAALNGHESTVALLLDHADTDAAGLGEALTCAARYGEGGALDILISGAQQLECFSWPQGILAHAVSAGLENLVSALVRAGHDLNEAGYDYPLDEGDNNSRDWRALHLAVEFGQDRLLSILLSSGRVDLGLEDRDENSALALATKFGTAASIRQLLDAGANLRAHRDFARRDFDFMEELLYDTIVCGNYPALEVLIDAKIYSTELIIWGTAGDDIEKCAWHMTMLAARRGFSRCTRVLLNNGVDPNTLCHERTPLYFAIDYGPHIETCRTLLDRGADPEKSGAWVHSPLKRAIQSGDKVLVEMLLDHGAQLRNDRDTSLTCAVENDQYEIMELLLDRGANPNSLPDGEGLWYGSWDHSECCSPLFVAVWNRRGVRFIETLIGHGANVHWREGGMKEYTVLHGAYDTPDTLSLLLQNGADINATTADGQTVLMRAVESKSKECVQVLLEQTNPKADIEVATTDEWGMTALTYACGNYDADILELLLEAGADINRPRADGLSPLMLLIAIPSGIRDDDVTMMIKRGARLDLFTTSEEGTILHEIYDHTPLSLVIRLVEEGAPVNIPNMYGETPLTLAVQRGNLSAARYLTTVKGVQSNVTHPGFGSILHAAAEASTLEMVKQLVRTGADPHVVDPGYKESASVLYSAIGNGDKSQRQKIVRYLVEELGSDVEAPGGNLGSPLLRAVADGLGNSLVKYLLRHGAHPDQSDKFGRSPAHWAVLRDDLDALKTLGQFGADFSKADNFGRTPLHFAASRGKDTSRLEMIAYICEKAPRDVDIINIADVDGWTPLMWACKTRGTVSDRLGLVLINDYKADARIRSRNGEWSALKMATLVVKWASENRSTRLHGAREYLDALANCVETQGGEKSLIKRDRKTKSLPSSYSDRLLCTGCMTDCNGLDLTCRGCDSADFRLCFKCSAHAGEMHDQNHTLDVGERYGGDTWLDTEADLSVHESGSGSEDETEEDKTESETEEDETERETYEEFGNWWQII